MGLEHAVFGVILRLLTVSPSYLDGRASVNAVSGLPAEAVTAVLIYRKFETASKCTQPGRAS
jgi:hypothetical protein